MAQLIDVVKLIVSLLPMIMELINGLEKAFPQSGQGASKLAVVKAILSGASDVAQDAAPVMAAAMPALERTVGALVDLKKGADAAG